MSTADSSEGSHELSLGRSGRIVFPDRLQRLAISIVLLTMTILGLIDGFGWKKAIALSLQIELLLTGLAGWCPFYWACSIRSRKP